MAGRSHLHDNAAATCGARSPTVGAWRSACGSLWRTARRGLRRAGDRRRNGVPQLFGAITTNLAVGVLAFAMLLLVPSARAQSEPTLTNTADRATYGMEANIVAGPGDHSPAGARCLALRRRRCRTSRSLRCPHCVRHGPAQRGVRLWRSGRPAGRTGRSRPATMRPFPEGSDSSPAISLLRAVYG